MSSFDPGPPAAVARHFASLPSYAPFKASFWFDWGPVFYRGRLNKTARVLCIASDPGPTERIANRTLVGDAGQRAQGFLRKIGLTKSYVCLNAFSYAMIPNAAAAAEPLLADPAQRQWRNQLFSLVTGPKLQAVVAFGVQAQKALALWVVPAGVTTFNVPHPSSHDEAALLTAWRAAIVALRGIVTPDVKALAASPNYGAAFAESDYAAVPAADLPFGVHPRLGDDAWVRAATPQHPSSVTRPQPDDRHTLIWKVPAS